MKILETSRLILREWRDADIPVFVAMNQDPKVMEFFPRTLSPQESETLLQRFRDHFTQHKFGPFALELKSTKEFIGFTGLMIPSFDAHFMPAVEIGWRLDSKHFGQGYATEAAKEVLRFAFDEIGLEEIVSFTIPANKASRNVMEKIGMKRDLDGDFKHPRIAEDNPCCWQVLYRIKNSYLS